MRASGWSTLPQVDPRLHVGVECVAGLYVGRWIMRGKVLIELLVILFSISRTALFKILPY